MTGPDVTGMDEYAEKAAADRYRHMIGADLPMEERAARAKENAARTPLMEPGDFAWSDEDTYPPRLDAPTSFPNLEPRRIYTEADLEAARVEERERIALDLHERAQSVTWWLSYTGLARKDAFETAARIARGEAT